MIFSACLISKINNHFAKKNVMLTIRAFKEIYVTRATFKIRVYWPKDQWELPRAYTEQLPRSVSWLLIYFFLKKENIGQSKVVCMKISANSVKPLQLIQYIHHLSWGTPSQVRPYLFLLFIFLFNRQHLSWIQVS